MADIVKKIRLKEHLLRKRGKMPPPKELIFEPTVTCNLSCSTCERYVKPSELKIKELELPEIVKFIKKLPKTIKRVYITGGEPFMRSDLIDICKTFLKRNILVDLQTNGTFVERALELSKIDGINLLFSLDGPKDIHNKIRGSDFVYERNMKIYHALGKQMGKSSVITTVISEANLHVLIKLVKLLKEEKVKPAHLAIELERRITQEIVEETSKVLEVTAEDLPIRLKAENMPSYSYQKFIECVTELKKELKSNHFNFNFIPTNLLDKSRDFYYRTYRKNNNLYCMHLDILRIDSEGDIIPCFNIRKKLGNVLNSSIEDIWNSKECCEFRVNLIENNLAPICETCFRAVDSSFYKEQQPLMRVKNRAKKILDRLLYPY